VPDLNGNRLKVLQTCEQDTPGLFTQIAAPYATLEKLTTENTVTAKKDFTDNFIVVSLMPP
jgi:hypothetical protein